MKFDIEIDTDELIEGIAKELRMDGLLDSLLERPEFSEAIKTVFRDVVGTGRDVINSRVNHVVDRIVVQRLGTMDVEKMIRDAVKSAVHRRVNERVEATLTAVLNGHGR